MQQKQKSRSQHIHETIWASPALFNLVSWILFTFSRSHERDETAWLVYFAGWVPPLLMGLWCLLARRKPHAPAASFAFVALVVFGVLFWLDHHESLPF